MSAGGVATNLWNNYVKNFVGDANKVYSISDSGIFMNFKNFSSSMKIQSQTANIYKVANMEESTPVA